MKARFVSIWFRHLSTDWFSIRQPALKNVPLVLRSPSHGRMIITSANDTAEMEGIRVGMPLADARAIIEKLEVADDRPDLAEKLLRRLAEWCIRFTPIAAIDLPHGLILDVSGCTHLWKGDESYLNCILQKLQRRGYDVRAAMADTIGAAWAVARFGRGKAIVPGGRHAEFLMDLPPEALRLEPEALDRLHKLGLHEVRQLMRIPRSSLRRRFGAHLLMRLDQAWGREIETIEPVCTPELYQERLPCMEPMVTLTAIEIALRKLLEILCLRLMKEQKGLRQAIFKGYRVDGKTVQISIGTNRPSHHVEHLYKLFEINLSTIEPALGIELFLLEAPVVEDFIPSQEKMWEGSGGLRDERLSELIDRLASKVGMNAIQRFVPDQHHWPERSYKLAASLQEKPAIDWPNKLRPLQFFYNPEPIEVTAPIPDYPPMLFIHKGKLHEIVRADGPERIEQEWWLQQGQHRDYYRVEDKEGRRYWLFRSGHYEDKTFQWYLHGEFS